MNKVRRKNINDAVKRIEEQLELLRGYQLEEEMSFDSLTEGLQCTARGEEMEECIDILDTNIGDIENALEEIKEI